ncbi:MAG TPA: putative toxin-antitoxin system toxin component, PIN family [Methylomirabilota bacterium]|nr:putative toxin-antitoxin system toxin component, PIN family [Methylomirabilota bacterium]
MRVVLDTNVIISATLIRGGNEDQILRAWQRGVFELVLSPPILEELGRALFYEKFRKFRWMTEEEVSELLQTLAASSVVVSGRVKIKASRDPDDDKFLAAATEAEARFVVTGDRDLLDLKNYRGARIIRPLPFLKIIRRASPSRD